METDGRSQKYSGCPSPRQRVAEWLGGDEKHPFLSGEVGNRETDVREEGAHQQRDVLPHRELVGRGQRVADIAAVVARNDFEGPAEHAALVVDLGERQL